MSTLHVTAIPVLLAVLVGTSAAQDEERFSVAIEGGLLWQNRNDVRIPNDATATQFSLVDVVGAGPYGAFRIEADFDVAEKHGFRVVAAPLVVEDDGLLANPVSFAGETFAPGAVEATYKFSSYRFTYRYRFYNGDRWRWKVGFTGFIRDARIALEQGDLTAEDTDVGFVPLAYVQGRAILGERWRLMFEVDALGASQGRAIDFSAKLAYDLNESWQLGLGYRTIEGGADVDDVFNFAWLNFAVASIRYSF